MVTSVITNNNPVATPAPTSAPSNATKAGVKLGSDFNTFLNLLTTQLKNQDPSNPMDANAFTQQLVAFSGVQQQVATNANLEKLIAASQGNQINSAVSFIGKTVEAPGDKGYLGTNGAIFGYNLDSAATKVNVSISDSSGRIVFNGQGPVVAGRNTVVWDGVNSFNGSTEKKGSYKMVVSAKDAAGADIVAKPFTIGVVDAATIKDGAVQLSIGDLSVSQTAVTRVTDPVALQQASAQ